MHKQMLLRCPWSTHVRLGVKLAMLIGIAIMICAPLPAAGASFDGGNDNANDTLVLIGGSGADSAVYNAGTAVFDGSTITLNVVDNFSFNGAGGNDNLTVNNGLVAIFSNQQL